MTGTIYAVSSLPEWLDVADHLAARTGWQPRYWLTQSGRNDAAVATRFPAVLAHSAQDANRGIGAPGYADAFNYPFGTDDIAALCGHERVALQLMDRMDLDGSFTFIERRRTWYRLVGYWMNVIQHMKLGVAVFNTPPHGIAEYALYAAARYLGLLTPVYQSTALSGLLFITPGVEFVSEAIASAYRDALQATEPPVLDPENAAYMSKLRDADASVVPWYVPIVQGQAERQHERWLKRQSRLKRDEPTVSDVPSRWWARWWRGSAQQVPAVESPEVSAAMPAKVSSAPFRRVYKEAERSLEHSRVGRAAYNAYLERVYPRKLAAKRVYESLCSEPDINSTFVYVPLHYQPERTTCPDGGVFNDQQLMIGILAAALPEGWLLYVKEHPTQFSYAGTGEQSRTEQYYQDLMAHACVRLLPTTAPSIKLIEHARAIATVTGMAGWEALSRGRPVMVFGHAWYRQCRGAYSVTTLAECRAALSAIAGGARPTHIEVDAFVAALEHVGARGYVNPSNAPAIQIDYDEHVSNLTELLFAWAQLVTETRQ